MTTVLSVTNVIGDIAIVPKTRHHSTYVKDALNMKSMGATTKTLYAAAFNLQGLYSQMPIKVTWDEVLESYWDKDGDFDIDAEGLDDSNPCCIKFAHKDKKIVQIWIDGARAACDVINQITQPYN